MFDSRAADDFTIPGDVVAWDITGLDVQGEYFQDAQHNLNSLAVWFYADTGNNLPGNLAFQATLSPAGAGSGDFGVTFSPVVRLAGGSHYWVAVQANKDYATGQWLWSEYPGQNHAPSVWTNPGGGYQTQCTGWGARVAVCGNGAQPDLAFRLLGNLSTDVPVPVLTALDPAAAGFRDFTLTVRGVNLLAGATLQFTVGGTTHNLATNVLNSTTLTAVVTEDMVSTAGQIATVTVTNAGDCGGSCVSNALNFLVSSPLYLPLIVR
jgi:hypothetical protein